MRSVQTARSADGAKIHAHHDVPSWITMWAMGDRHGIPALEHEGRVITYGGMSDGMLRRAAAFARTDATRIVVHRRDPIDAILDTLGVLAAGKSPLLLNPSYPEEMVSAFVRTSEGILSTTLEVPARPLERAIATPGSADGVLLTTSGSTGTPKIVRRTRQGDATAALTNPLRGWPIRHGSRQWHPTPVASGGFLSLILGTLVVGGCVVLDKFSGSDAGRFVRDARIDGVYLVPTMLRLVLADPGFREEHWTSLKMLFWGGEPMDPGTEAAIVSAMGDIIHAGYGSTETPLVAATDPVDRAAFGRSAGHATAMHTLRIVDDEGNVLPTGEEGEIQAAGADSYLGYLNETDPVGEWYSTGDFGRLDETGHLHVNGRRSQVVNIGGNRVSPEESAALLRARAEIHHAAVVAIEDSVWGSRLHAFVTLAPGASIDPRATLETMKRSLPSVRVPRGLTILDEMPVDPSGKLALTVLQRTAREAVEREKS
jgi:acyl-CoA synthetase (AMP-forming)/AMP-acid ligase II